MQLTPPHSSTSYRTKRNSCGCQPNEPAISSVRLVHGIGIVVAQLLYDLLDPVEFFSSSKITNNSLKTVWIPVSFIRLSGYGFLL